MQNHEARGSVNDEEVSDDAAVSRGERVQSSRFGFS